MLAKSSHPYFPIHLQLHDFVPQSRTITQITGGFFVVVIAVSIGLLSFTKRVKHFSQVERAMFCWWMVTGAIHFFMEGAFAVMTELHKDKSGNIFADIWKEYSKGDSRYIARDTFVVSMEGLTAFAWGPLSFVIAYGMFHRLSWRYPLMMLVSLGQIYGDVLYFVTCFMEDLKHSRPEPFYFWFYFITLNAVWIIVPAMVLTHAWKICVKALEGKSPSSGTASRSRSTVRKTK